MKEKFPSVVSKDKLNDLSKTFKPKDVKFLLALNTDFSEQECIDSAAGMIGRLQDFVNGNHTGKDLEFPYANKKVF